MTKEDFEQLKSTVKQWLFHTGSLDPTNYANELKLKFIEPKENRIENLEKENADLEKANKTLATMNNNMWVELEKKRAESQGITNKLHQLLKAKEIIRALLKHTHGQNLNTQNDFDLYLGRIKDAEQFLQEE